MNNEVIPYLDQLPELNRVEFLQKLEAQLAKDLYPVEWGELSAEPTPISILTKLQHAVFNLIQNHNNSLSQILYRVDISEGKIRSLMASTTSEKRAEILAFQLLEREAKKVWLRMNYR
jgi:DNA-binding CsgD family transcriptional regulator